LAATLAAGAETTARAAGAETARAAGAAGGGTLVTMHPWKSARHWSIVFFEAIY
jgi:hypothetical protein